MIKEFIFTTCALLAGSSAIAQATTGEKLDKLQLNTITTAVPFVAITPDSRAGGMGDAGTALGASSSSIYWNTSILNFSDQKSEIGLSYTPWLRQLTNDIHLSYLSGYYKVNDRHVIGGGLRYFNLGSITFTDAQGNFIREDKPSEFELAAAYGFRLSERMSVGLNGKFIYSNLTGGLTIPGVDTKPGIAGAADLSLTYYKDDAKIGNTRGVYTFAFTINNIGNKIIYSNGSTTQSDFLPMNLKIGNSFKADFDKYNSVTFSLDIQKLLVPTPRKVYNIDGETHLEGRDGNVGVIAGMLQSFYDAPGELEVDASGNYIPEGNGYKTRSGSRLLEELSEINLAFGMEYWYNNVFAVRGGFFYEHPTKGARQFFNLGAGFRYNKFGIDISYLAALKRNNPLANTLRFTLSMALGGKSYGNGSSSAPE